MKNRVMVGTLVVLAFVFFSSAPAFAQATRTWVSGVGDDANPCSRTAPCKTFAGAISKTAVGGEICVLDPGGFGAVTITKSISIRNDGVGTAGVLVSNTNGIVIQVPNASDTVILRGLDIEGLGTGISGILVNTGGNVFIEDCTINKFTIAGINFLPTVAGSSLHVTNVLVRNNGTVGNVNSGGIVVGPTAAAQADIWGAHMDSNVVGFKTTTANGTVSIVESIAANSSAAGFANGGGTVNLERSVSTKNSTGVNCAAGTTRLGNMSITDNTTAVANPGACTTFKTNDIDTAGIAFGTTTIQQ